ncbi:ferric reductase-like transmembrane domain-containing protein [Aneurinibacillus terranovensis]|uniref:ferric reductase-like transmembrane domain-containing protein n=1 Tax=Aneurinibacillus terranovensis TaxID=278991 RepID=UPI00042240DB|nr:ferric reductase-like transmembrane domain-containing protein [Aneurinibacillus terranovensis]
MENIMATIGSWIPVWDASRAAGLTAYLLLFFATVAGIMQSMKLLPPKARGALAVFHANGSWIGLLFGMTHGLLLLFDQYVGYTLRDIFVPFSTHYKPIETALGIFTFYVMFVLILSSDLMKRIGKKMWRMIHFLSFPGYLAALFHGLLMGTDSQSEWILGMYLVTGAVVAILVVFRVNISLQAKKSVSARG